MAKKTETEKNPVAADGGTPSVATSPGLGSKAKIPSFFKSRWFLISLSLALLLGLGYLVYDKFQSAKDDPGEVELSYAEQLETYTLVEGASQETTNNFMLSRAWAHFNEGNYDKALERLNSITEPNTETKIAADDLYGEIYKAMGQVDKANEYGHAVLLEQEGALLEKADEFPDLHFSLARLYENAGDTDKAKIHYQKYLDAFDAPEGEVDEELIEALNIAKEKVGGL